MKARLNVLKAGQNSKWMESSETGRKTHTTEPGSPGHAIKPGPADRAESGLAPDSPTDRQPFDTKQRDRQHRPRVDAKLKFDVVVL